MAKLALLYVVLLKVTESRDNVKRGLTVCGWQFALWEA